MQQHKFEIEWEDGSNEIRTRYVFAALLNLFSEHQKGMSQVS